MNRSLLNNATPILWLIAFICALMPLNQYEVESFGVCFLLLCATIIITLSDLHNRTILAIPRSALLAIAAAFWLLSFISVTLSEAPLISFLYFCFFSAFPLSLAITLLHPDRDKFIHIVSTGLIIIYVILCLSCLCQYFFVPEMLYMGRVHYPFANPNSLTAVLSFALFAAFGRMLIAPDRKQSNLALGFAILIFAAMLTTGGRSAFIAAFIAFIPLLILAWHQVRRHSRCSLALAGSVILLFVVLNIMSPAETFAPSRILTTLSDNHSVFSSRPAIWLSTWEIIKNHIWTGTGIGTFYLYYPEHRGEDYVSAGIMAHNDPLQFWAEMGILAPLLFYVFMALACIRTLKTLQILKPEDPARIKILIPACALGAMILHTHGTFNFYVLPCLMLTGLFLAYWFKETEKSLPSTPWHITGPQLKSALCSIPVLLIILTALSFACLHSSFTLTTYAEKKIAKGDLNGFANDVNLAGKLSGSLNERAFAMAATIPIGLIKDHSETFSPEKIRNLYDQARSLLSKAKKLNPRYVNTYYYEAELVKAAGPALEIPPPESAESLLIKALKIDPLHSSSRIMLSDIYYQNGLKQKSLDILKEGLPWPYGNQDALAYNIKTSLRAHELGDTATYELTKKQAAGH